MFRQDCLLGTIIIKEDGSQKLFQTWDLETIKQFYYDYKDDSIFVGYNSKFYDNCILEAIIKNQDTYLISKRIVEDHESIWCNLKFYSYDVMNTGFAQSISLKLTELISGDSIETTEVDFNIDRPLIYEEKKLTEKYNQADLNKTLYNFKKIYPNFTLRLGIINDWKLDLMKYLDCTGAQLAAEVLKAESDASLEYKPVKPIIYDTMKIENKQAIDFYLNEKFRLEDYFETIKIGNAELTLGGGGIHQAIKKCYYSRLLYLDVSGYYNLVMILYNLLSRTIPEIGKERYKMMYDQQIELKKIDPDSPRRKQFKTILLAVFGAQGRKGSKLYDPYVGSLVPVVGEMFLIDLIEKIKDYCIIVQSNTDGIMLSPNSDEDEKKILEELNKFLDRTKFVIKPKYIYDLYQRDVNNYMYRDEKGNIEVKGEALKNYQFDDETYSAGKIFNAKEPSIIAKGVVDYLMYDIPPEETVNKYKEDLRLFQYACKKGTYNKLTYDITYFPTKETSSYEIQSPSRVFAYKSNTESGMIYKHGINKKSGKISKAKVSNLPDNVFIYNNSIIGKYEELKDKIDWQYYIDRIYEKIEKFIS